MNSSRGSSSDGLLECNFAGDVVTFRRTPHSATAHRDPAVRCWRQFSASVDGRLADAGLDVFADEPNVPEALLSMDNVVVLPNVGSGTVETRAVMENLTLRNLNSFLETGRLVTPVQLPVTASR